MRFKFMMVEMKKLIQALSKYLTCVSRTKLCSEPLLQKNLLKKLEVEIAKFGLMVKYFKTKITVIDRPQQFPETQTIVTWEAPFSKICLSGCPNC